MKFNLYSQDDFPRQYSKISVNHQHSGQHKSKKNKKIYLQKTTAKIRSIREDTHKKKKIVVEPVGVGYPPPLDLSGSKPILLFLQKLRPLKKKKFYVCLPYEINTIYSNRKALKWCLLVFFIMYIYHFCIQLRNLTDIIYRNRTKLFIHNMYNRRKIKTKIC